MTHFSRDTLEDLMQTGRDKMGLPAEGDWLWGYYFVDTDHEKLVAAGRALERDGYRFVEVFAGENSNGEPAKTADGIVILYLHVEKIEHHTVESLLARNELLNEFARKRGLADYDGMDIGRVAT